MGGSRADLTEALAQAVNKLSEDVIILKNDDDDNNILSPFHLSTFGANSRLIGACHGGTSFANNTHTSIKYFIYSNPFSFAHIFSYVYNQSFVSIS